MYLTIIWNKRTTLESAVVPKAMDVCRTIQIEKADAHLDLLEQQIDELIQRIERLEAQYTA